MQNLKQKISDKSAKIAIAGLGYVGLPLAVAFANKGFSVIGIDLSEEKVKLLNDGLSYITDIPQQELEPLVKSGKLKATTDYSVLEKADLLSICVPTPLAKTKDPDVSYIMAVTAEIKKYLHQDLLIVLESTTYPGTTRELVLPPLLESGLKVGKDFFLAFSPERIDPGNKVFKVENTPKVIGGITKECAEVASFCYQQVIDKVVPVSSTDSAEMVKLLENTFRSVNIGLVNEVAIMCRVLKVDPWEVIEAAGSKPFGFMPFYPGPGLGGHCIPIDPLYLSWKLKTLDYNARFIELAGEINSNMPRWVISRVNDLLNDKQKSIKGSKIMILGVAYKKDIGDLRESPAIEICRLLLNKGALISYHDPYVEKLEVDEHHFSSKELNKENLQASDLVILTTDHSVFDLDNILSQSKLLFDTRNASRNCSSNNNVVYL